MDDSMAWLDRHAPNGVLDLYVNGNPPVEAMGDYVSKEFFKSTIAARSTTAELVELMDESRIVWALLAPPPETTMEPALADRWALETVQAFPGRFGLTVRIDPISGMKGVRRLESMVKNDGLRAIRFAPYRLCGPPSDRRYYPLYSKCVELGLPITILSGLNVTARGNGYHQHPSHLDVVCDEWPELTVITAHGGMPWTEELVALMRKWPNLYHTLSAVAPSRYPRVMVDFLNTQRGRSKVIFSSDYPIINFDRALRAMPGVGISDEAIEPFLFGNANRIFAPSL